MRRNKKEAFNDASFFILHRKSFVVQSHYSVCSSAGKIAGEGLLFMCYKKVKSFCALFIRRQLFVLTIVPKALKTRENPGECCGLLLKRSRCVR